MPAPNMDNDLSRDFPDFFASDMWPSLWPRIIHRYATVAARDADMAGLGATDRAFCYVDALARTLAWTGTGWHAIGIVASYTSVGGAAPTTVVGNTNGTVLQTLLVPAVAFDRVLSVSMLAYLSSTQTADSWETVGNFDSLNIATNVLGRFCMTLNSASSAGSGVIPATRLILLANQATTLRVWVRRVAGTGTGTGSADPTYCNIQALASAY